ncbi:MAG: hypothetical protein LBQ24_03310 [Candidatus Peribacteria bacterium]|nr:hypothetical protein [Candidatus Peribacteria bacterium]
MSFLFSFSHCHLVVEIIGEFRVFISSSLKKIFTSSQICSLYSLSLFLNFPSLQSNFIFIFSFLFSL